MEYGGDCKDLQATAATKVSLFLSTTVGLLVIFTTFLLVTEMIAV